ncbi:hypothetical protein EDD86DRAFT_248639 [Gorgonomyces haynaldii]|nr:hypothetical protein EDD86DRAFT_248639 [Gorgonomyces haynaldii]
MPMDHHRHLFNNIEKIGQLSQKLVSQMDQTNVGQVLAQHLDPHTDQRPATKYLSTLLDCPRQHYDNYSILITDLISKSNDQQELLGLRKTMHSLEELNQRVKSAIAQRTHTKYMQQLQENLMDSLESYGLCRLKDTFSISAKKSKLYQSAPRICFLFDHCLVIVKESFRGFFGSRKIGWSIEQEIKISPTVFKHIHELPHPNCSILLGYIGQDFHLKAIVLTTQNQHQMRQWIQHLTSSYERMPLPDTKPKHKPSVEVQFGSAFARSLEGNSAPNAVLHSNPKSSLDLPRPSDDFSFLKSAPVMSPVMLLPTASKSVPDVNHVKDENVSLIRKLSRKLTNESEKLSRKLTNESEKLVRKPTLDSDTGLIRSLSTRSARSNHSQPSADRLSERSKKDSPMDEIPFVPKSPKHMEEKSLPSSMPTMLLSSPRFIPPPTHPAPATLPESKDTKKISPPPRPAPLQISHPMMLQPPPRPAASLSPVLRKEMSPTSIAPPPNPAPLTIQPRKVPSPPTRPAPLKIPSEQEKDLKKATSLAETRKPQTVHREKSLPLRIKTSSEDIRLKTETSSAPITEVPFRLPKAPHRQPRSAGQKPIKPHKSPSRSAFEGVAIPEFGEFDVMARNLAQVIDQPPDPSSPLDSIKYFNHFAIGQSPLTPDKSPERSPPPIPRRTSSLNLKPL